jgi:hypothetical protein
VLSIDDADEGEDVGYSVPLEGVEGLVERARREGFLVWDAGSVGSSDDPVGVRVYTDQCCTHCDHVPCPCCEVFCDVRECIFDDEGTEGVEQRCLDECCAYPQRPRFFTNDGSLWEGGSDLEDVE